MPVSCECSLLVKEFWHKRLILLKQVHEQNELQYFCLQYVWCWFMLHSYPNNPLCMRCQKRFYIFFKEHSTSIRCFISSCLIYTVYIIYSKSLTVCITVTESFTESDHHRYTVSSSTSYLSLTCSCCRTCTCRVVALSGCLKHRVKIPVMLWGAKLHRN